jgi:hypothetical protein
MDICNVSLQSILQFASLVWALYQYVGLCTSHYTLSCKNTQNQMLEFPQKQNPTAKLIQQIPDQHPISSVLAFCQVQ